MVNKITFLLFPSSTTLFWKAFHLNVSKRQKSACGLASTVISHGWLLEELIYLESFIITIINIIQFQVSQNFFFYYSVVQSYLILCGKKILFNRFFNCFRGRQGSNFAWITFTMLFQQQDVICALIFILKFRSFTCNKVSLLLKIFEK